MIENNSINLGDCLDLMKQIPDASVDMILCDLPYGKTACKWDSIIPFKDLWAAYNRIAKPSAAIALFGSEPFSSQLRLSQLEAYKYDWYWQKNLMSGFLLAKKQPLRCVETISLFYSKQPTYNPEFEPYADSCKKRFSEIKTVKSAETRLNNQQGVVAYQHNLNFERGKYPSNLKAFKCEHTANSNRLHPTQKPVALFEYLIKTYTNPGDLVLDNCSGSGTTAIACSNTKRRFICIEKDPIYYEKSLLRLKALTK